MMNFKFEFYPTMSYISSTDPGITSQGRTSACLDQADLFCFIGPSNFKMRMWTIGRTRKPTMTS